jgi:uncharacterized damage-inducible protein DinB
LTAQTIQTDALSAAVIRHWEQVGNKLFTLAEAFPGEKYDTVPLEGIRTLADVLRHVAFWNLHVAALARGQKADETANELSKAKYSDKARLLAALARSTADAAAALQGHAGGLDPETVELVVTFIEHSSEHYGQLVVYARLSGIVPPASRG